MRLRLQNKFIGVSAALISATVLSAEVKVLKNFTLIDGTGRAPVANSGMIIDDGRIRWIGPAAQLKAPAKAEVIDLSGKFVMPGIINLHGHVGNTIGLEQNAKFFTRENIERNLRAYASYGVTTVLSLGTDQDLIFQIRREQRAARPSETRVFTAGEGFMLKGGYGGLAGVTKGVSSAAEVEPAIAALAAKHVDIVKIWLDDHLGATKKMPYDIAKEIIDQSHAHHLPVVAHIFYLEDAQKLVDFGINGLAHSVRDRPVDRALIESMKRHGTWQMAATLTREASMFVYGDTPPFANDPFFTRSVSADVLRTLKSPQYQQSIRSDPAYGRYGGFFETAKKNLKALADAGVKYGFGTDTGPPGRFPGYFEQWEMELMVKAGLTPMQVITAATGNSAQFLGAKDLGTLEPSKWADLLVLDGNPVADIRNTRKIAAVYIAGNRINTDVQPESARR
jgi:imidazolonepropionase-like amidohydrolase